MNATNPEILTFHLVYKMGAGHFISRDNVNSLRAVRDNSASAIGSKLYGPYGHEWYSSGLACAQGYAGQSEGGSAELSIAAFRVYCTKTNRWLSRDPFGMVDGTNLYAYVSRNCIIANDPTGLSPDPGNFDIICDQDGVAIYYKAPTSAQCDEIKFIQIVRTNQTGIDFYKPGHYWHIDDETSSGDVPDSPYYPFPVGKPKPDSAGMTDQPNPGGIGGTQDFETCAVCAKGTDKGKVYGCRAWSAKVGPLSCPSWKWRGGCLG